MLQRWRYAGVKCTHTVKSRVRSSEPLRLTYLPLHAVLMIETNELKLAYSYTPIHHTPTAKKQCNVVNLAIIGLGQWRALRFTGIRQNKHYSCAVNHYSKHANLYATHRSQRRPILPLPSCYCFGRRSSITFSSLIMFLIALNDK